VGKKSTALVKQRWYGTHQEEGCQLSKSRQRGQGMKKGIKRVQGALQENTGEGRIGIGVEKKGGEISVHQSREVR